MLRLDPTNRYALTNLQKLHEEQHQWLEAYQLRQQLSALDEAEGEPSRGTPMILAFLDNELGLEAEQRGDLAEAVRRFEAAIDREPATVPAYLNLGDLRERQGDLSQAAAAWERVLEVAPGRADLAFESLQRAYAQIGAPDRFVAV